MRAIESDISRRPICWEMILPTSANTHHKNVDGKWARLISYSFPHRAGYQNTDEVFVDQWDETIDFYEKQFVGVPGPGPLGQSE